MIFDWETVSATIATFRDAAAAAGRDPDSLPVLLQVNGNITDRPLDERSPLLGSPEQAAPDLERADAVGVSHIYWNSSDGDPLEQLPLLAQLRR